MTFCDTPPPFFSASAVRRNLYQRLNGVWIVLVNGAIHIEHILCLLLVFETQIRGELKMIVKGNHNDADYNFSL